MRVRESWHARSYERVEVNVDLPFGFSTKSATLVLRTFVIYPEFIVFKFYAMLAAAAAASCRLSLCQFNQYIRYFISRSSSTLYYTGIQIMYILVIHVYLRETTLPVGGQRGQLQRSDGQSFALLLYSFTFTGHTDV